MITASIIAMMKMTKIFGCNQTYDNNYDNSNHTYTENNGTESESSKNEERCIEKHLSLPQ